MSHRLVGQKELLEDLREVIETAALDSYTPPPIALVGPRGVGKSVLLIEVGDMAGEEFGWPRIHIEVRTNQSLIPRLVSRLDEARAR
jgi:predicted AAA+ superfamily ATPase